MNKVTFTKHAEKKFEYLKELGIDLEVNDLEDTIFNPDYFSEDKLNQIKTALKQLKNLNLRVIYSDRGGIIRVITFYPVEDGRYRK